MADVEALIEQAQEDLETVLFSLVGERDDLRALVRAVNSREFSGIECNDVDGKSWFDERVRLLG